eukprot:scaffold7233_cov570-Prasinococcus_capsulatus_cf.AAC.12
MEGIGKRSTERHSVVICRGSPCWSVPHRQTTLEFVTLSELKDAVACESVTALRYTYQLLLVQ